MNALDELTTEIHCILELARKMEIPAQSINRAPDSYAKNSIFFNCCKDKPFQLPGVFITHKNDVNGEELRIVGAKCPSCGKVWYTRKIEESK